MKNFLAVVIFLRNSLSSNYSYDAVGYQQYIEVVVQQQCASNWLAYGRGLSTYIYGLSWNICDPVFDLVSKGMVNLGFFQRQTQKEQL